MVGKSDILSIFLQHNPAITFCNFNFCYCTCEHTHIIASPTTVPYPGQWSRTVPQKEIQWSAWGRKNIPSNKLISMSLLSGLCRHGYVLKRFATKARFSFGFPETTSAGVTNCLQPSLSASWSMNSARFRSFFSYTGKENKMVNIKLLMT